MAGLRFLPVFAVLVICYQGSLAFNQESPLDTLKEILADAVKENVIPKDKADRLIAVCAQQQFKKESPAEVLEEALEIGWRNVAISTTNSEKLQMWASKAYPNTFEPLEILFTSEVIEVFKSNVPHIETKLGQLSGNKLKAVNIVATLLNESAEEGGITMEDAAEVIEEVIKYTLNENADAMTALNKAIAESVSRQFVSESLAWFIIRAAINEDIDKGDN